MKNKKVSLNCQECGKEFKCSPSHAKYRKNCSLYCSNHGKCKNTGRTHFKKGQVGINKDKFLVEKPKQRRTAYYRRLVLQISENQFCNRCDKEAKLVHHKNRDIHDNRIENLEPLCNSCHSKEHETYKNFKYVGYEAVIVGRRKKDERRIYYE